MVEVGDSITHTEMWDTDLPKVTSIISLCRWIAHEFQAVIPYLRGTIAEEYLNVYNVVIADLEECVEDLDITYFQLRGDKQSNDLISELDGI